MRIERLGHLFQKRPCLNPPTKSTPLLGNGGALPMKRFRRNAEYATDSRVFRSIDRNQRVRIIASAEALERRTKAKGQKSGVPLGLSGLQLLRCLLFRFCAIPTGRCCPSYRAIRETTGFCYSTISGALKRLETSGLVRIARRLYRALGHGQAAQPCYPGYKAPRRPEHQLDPDFAPVPSRC